MQLLVVKELRIMPIQVIHVLIGEELLLALTLTVPWTGTEWTIGDQSNPDKEHLQLRTNGLQCILMIQPH